MPAGRGAAYGLTFVGKNDNEGLVTPVIPVAPRATVTAYLNAEGIAWSSDFTQTSTDGEDEVFVRSNPRSYQARRRYEEHVNFAVFGPALSQFTRNGVLRRGDDIYGGAFLFGDSAGNAGFAKVTAAHTRLFRDGQLVADIAQPTGVFPVPAGNGSYRLEMEATRDTALDLTSKVTAAWTFPSAHVDTTSVVQLPVSVIRFNPKLNDDNAAPAGVAFRVPFSVQQQSAHSGPLREVNVDVSYDDGQTWQKAKVSGGTAHLIHPAAAGFVSLRVKAADSKGNTVEQTIIHAYRLVPR
jgi:hypothetical protein